MVKSIFTSTKKAYLSLLNILKSNSTVKQKVETLMVVLALSIMALALADTFLVDNLAFTRFVEVFDLLVCGVFLIDLIYRYKYWEKSKKDFIKTSWIEMIAVIPFDIVFRFFRIARLLRVAKISRVSKLNRIPNILLKLTRSLEVSFLSFLKSGSYARFKRFNKLVFGFGKNKSKEQEEKNTSDTVKRS
ncbi:hypothetical protein RH915_09055 [Serpentinicella sp. ANB-PHB4]|uniref:ion transporter n=1 Tax=Serpentinicella sp. ANB-PHB4 TaxID=3074076 RepID=UPI002859BA19|nr:ion transporter [Serpentinicella sp. ANB-PHB4]MDR5659642.1 hypothetical protein [Serpentinicella sp. ANB-PHB4]